jgi:hypothetical protein
MQSADYVPGVSGWKIENGLIELNGGPHGVVRLGDIDKPEAMASQFFVDPARWAIKLRANTQGQYVAAGIGLDLSEFEQAKSKGADAVLDYIGAAICNTQLGQGLKSRTNELSELIRQVIRQELRPGGLLHRR